jgi:hypothetical protein
MGELVNLRCPYCGEQVEVWIDLDITGTFVQDCEVCCRPWQIYVHHDEEGALSLDITRAQ